MGWSGMHRLFDSSLDYIMACRKCIKSSSQHCWPLPLYNVYKNLDPFKIEYFGQTFHVALHAKPTPSWFNPTGAETVIFRKNQANTMPADALAPSVSRASAMVFYSQDQPAFCIHQEWFELPTPTQCREMLKKMPISIFFLTIHCTKSYTVIPNFRGW